MPCFKDKFFCSLLVLLLFFKAGALVCLYFCNPLGEQALIFPDSLSYIYPAQTWLAYGQFWEAVSANPLLLRTPGYPVFLGIISLLTGNLTWAVAAVQNILSVLLLIPVYLTARELAGQTAARISTVLAGISVLYFSLSFAVLSEIPCTFLLAWFMYFAVRFLHTTRTRPLIAAAVCLAVAVYVRPAAYYFTLVTALLFFVLQTSSWKKILLGFTAPLLLLVGAWHVRNFATTGYAGFSTVNAYNFYFWNEDFVARQNGFSVPQAHEWLQERLPQNFAAMTAGEQVKIYRFLGALLLKAGWKYKLVHAPQWAAKTLLGVNFVHTSRLLLGAPTDETQLAFDTLNQTKSVHVSYLKSWPAKLIFGLSFLQVLLVVILGTTGLAALYKSRQKAAVFLMVYCLYFWTIGSVFFGAYARFRAPFEFVLCIGAAIAILRLGKRLQAKRQRIN